MMAAANIEAQCATWEGGGFKAQCRSGEEPPLTSKDGSVPVTAGFHVDAAVLW